MIVIRPFALHTTWTTYATWLPGDARGHVSNVRHAGGGFTPKQNAPGTPYAAGDAHTHATATARQAHPTVWLTPAQAERVVRTLVETAAA